MFANKDELGKDNVNTQYIEYTQRPITTVIPVTRHNTDTVKEP